MDTKSKIYFDLNLILAKTLLIKSETSAASINDLLIKNNIPVNDVDKTTWKYYRNISGSYHSSDEIMKIISLDTLEEIVFSKENLLLHTATMEAYNYGTRYYYSLLNRYPKQEQLILGILYPVDINTAIEGEDGTILSYPKYLVEEQEITLIYELNEFIKNYLVRWNVPAFGLSDSLYNTAQHAIMYLNILPKLINLRLKRCKTYEAHSFHIKQYLSSHGKLDKYMPFMTLKQILYLYRNILYIERNSGKSEQLKELINILLSERNIPIDELSIRHIDQFDTNYYPDVNVRRKAINKQYNISEKDYFDIDALYEKIRFLNTGNHEYLLNESSDMNKLFQNSSSAIIQTKHLESSMVDYSNAVPDTLDNVLLRQWVSMANNNLYNGIVTFRDPKSLLVSSLKAIDAFTYMYYLILKSMNINIETIPNYTNIKQRKLLLPSTEEMVYVVDKKYKEVKVLAEEILANQPEIEICLSASAFYDLSYKIYQQSLNHWFTVSNIADLNKRGMVSNMIELLYEDEIVILPDHDVLFVDWLLDNNLPEYDYTYTEVSELILEIFNKATGLINDRTTKLSNIQNAMISVLKQLSSYSIQFIYNTNASKITVLNWAAIRIGNFDFKLSNEHHTSDLIKITGDKTAISNKIDLTDNSLPDDKTKILHKYNIDLGSPLDMDLTLTVNYKIDMYEVSDKIVLDVI